jgi:hypothetical protein
MGAALVVKPGAGQRFSLVAFGLAQLVIDIEPGVRMMQGSAVLHGSSHTLIGALIIATLIAMVSPKIAYWIVTRWNQEVRFHQLGWLAENPILTKTAAISGAFFGTLSHIVLDALMHEDIHPLAPFSPVNPLLHLISHDGIYELCGLMGAIGAVTWVSLKYWRRNVEQPIDFRA